MKTRIISALVGTVILLAVLFCPYTWVFVAAAAALAAIAVWELLHNTGVVNNKLFLMISLVFSAAQVIACANAVENSQHVFMLNSPLTLWLYIMRMLPLLLLALYALLALVFFVVHRRTFVCKGFGLTVYATLGFAALACLRLAPSVFGLPFVMLPLVIAWMSDTGAYFVGTFFGKHKMAPVTSPKKSWEGFFGGWVISIGLTSVFGLICNAFIAPMSSLRIKVGLITVFAAVLAPLSVLGDLFASLIKRRFGIKDYGNIMPGHGGVMDRFDSVIFIAPLLWVLLELFH